LPQSHLIANTPNRPIKKGDVLFKIDPVPFDAAVKAAEATLRGLQDQLKSATAKKAALTPRIDLAKKRVQQFSALPATGAGKRADLEQAQSDLGNRGGRSSTTPKQRSMQPVLDLG
jgi:multidrug resistance efflux pump